MNLLNEIIDKIGEIEPSKPLLLKSILPTNASIKTSFNRELLHNYEHTTHHLALIKVGLTLLKSEVQLPEHFGVANSTIEHYYKVVLND